MATEPMINNWPRDWTVTPAEILIEMISERLNLPAWCLKDILRHEPLGANHVEALANAGLGTALFWYALEQMYRKDVALGRVHDRAI